MNTDQRLDTVELRHLRCFVAIAEQGSITAAAAQLGTSQPTVTRTLAQLEDRIGERLVERTTRRLGLTTLGRQLLPGVREALSALADALDPTSAGVRGVRLGHAWGGGGRHTLAVLRGWADRHPQVPIELVRVDDRLAGLTRGLSDLALLRGDIDDPDVETELLDEEPRVAALARGHPVVEKEHPVTMDDLADYPLVVNRVAGVTSRSTWPPRRRPRVGTEVTNTDDWLFAVAAGRGFGLTPASTAQLHQHPDVVYLSVADAPPVPLWVAWPTRSRHPWRAEVVDLCHEVVAKASAQSAPHVGPASRY